MPLTAKGAKIKSAMSSTYGAKKGEQVFYASKNAKKITGVDNAPWRATYDALVARTKDAFGNSFPENPPAKPQGKKNDVMGTIMSPKRSTEGGSETTDFTVTNPSDVGSTTPRKPTFPLAKPTPPRVAGQANRPPKQTTDRKLFFKGSVRDALRQGMPARDALKTALDRMMVHDALPPKVRASFDRVMMRRR